jgi:O-acetylhomoserine/O-acetylserine sulfhydrylase-like pyridoxal-dependent enzyme
MSQTVTITLKQQSHPSDASHGFGTNCIHAGQPSDPQTGAVIPPISLSTTFHQESPGIKKVSRDFAT